MGSPTVESEDGLKNQTKQNKTNKNPKIMGADQMKDLSMAKVGPI